MSNKVFKNKINPLKSILFVCDLNSIRSPIAEAILKVWFNKKIFIDSCGIRPGKIDPLAIEVMAELDFDLSNHTSKLMSQLEDSYFDLIITFSKDAYNASIMLTKTISCEVEIFDVPDASITVGNREQRLLSYRIVRDIIITKLKKRFKDYL